MKKFFVILLSAMLMLSLAVPAMAATNDSITINSAKVGETYKIYKLFDLVVDDAENPSKYSYTITTGWADFFASSDDGGQYVTVENGYVTAISDAAALAKAAANWASKPSELESIKADSTTVVFDALENGYYLITSTLGTLAMTETTPDKSDVTITEKNPEDTITKKVKEDSTGEYGNSNDAQIGDTVEFKSTITLYSGTRNVKVTDTMDSGLTYNKDAAIADLNEGTDYTIEETDSGFVITFTDSYLNGLSDTTELTLTYTATLNENAIKTDTNGTVIVDQNNKIVLTYGDKQTVEHTTITTTHKFSVFKHATSSNDNLADAVFQLKKNGTVVSLIKIDANNYRVAKTGETGVDTFTTVANGDIVIWGVDSDSDYTLLETAAPNGYNKLAKEVEVTVDAGNATRVDVENKSGTELPSTGGMGTTIFYIVGGIMVVGAVILLITKKRMSAEG